MYIIYVIKIFEEYNYDFMNLFIWILTNNNYTDNSFKTGDSNTADMPALYQHVL